VWGLLLGWNAGALLALLWMWRAVPEAPRLPGHPGDGLSLVKAGFPIFLYFAATALLRSIDRWALLYSGGEEALGLYGIGLMAFGLALYVPEAAAYVLFPRVAAAFHGSQDRALARDQCIMAQRALAVLVPWIVGLGMIWAGPVVHALLPDFRSGLPAMRVLAIGAAMYSAATVPGYYLLAAGRFRLLLGSALGALLVTAALVLSVASRWPAPTPVAGAAASGYTLFAAAVLVAASREWFPGSARSRRASLAAGLVPGAWVGASWLLLERIGSDASPGTAVVRTVVLALLYLPIAWWLGRGSGLGGLMRAWILRRWRPESGGRAGAA
jgi:O-antigen/teichoic acid export membrane protein